MASNRGRMVSAILALVLAVSGTVTAAEPTQPRQAEALASYLSMPAQENVMFHDGLDTDELIGAQVFSPNGTRLATVADLMVEADGRIRRAVIDPGSALGAGSRHVTVPIERLRRTEVGGGVLSLEITDAELRALPTYRRVDNRWEPIPRT